LISSILACGGEQAPAEPQAPVDVGKEAPAKTAPATPDASAQAGREPAERLPHKLFPDVKAALEEILHRTDPLVIGFGEVHQTTGNTEIESAVARFSAELLPVLASNTSNLVVETWVTSAACGKQEQQVLTDVKEHTERPDETETEVVVMMKRAKGLGIAPHILEVSCADYEKLLANDGEVDYWELLGLITRGLEDKTATLVGAAAARARPTVAIYGGAIHNDTKPYQELESFSYAADLAELTAGRYVEIDLLVPEFLETNEPMKQTSWYPQFAELTSPKYVVLIERSATSFIIGFKKGVAARKPPTP